MPATYFASAAEFRRWLETHHTSEKELLVGYHKVATGRPSMTWSESVDEALCFGWIDGVRRRVDDDRYTIRFSPRNPKSIWSAVNLAKMEVLLREGRVSPAGLRAYEARTPEKSVIYAYERGHAAFDAALESRFRANPTAWDFFQAQPAGYRKTLTWWVISAKQPDTRLRRLDQLIAQSAAGKRIL